MSSSENGAKHGVPTSKSKIKNIIIAPKCVC